MNADQVITLILLSCAVVAPIAYINGRYAERIKLEPMLEELRELRAARKEQT